MSQSESESETDSYSSFDSEASASEYGDESDQEKISNKEYDTNHFKNPDGSQLDLKTANVHASEYTLLFPHFIECVVRLILLRYQPVVSQNIVDAWMKEQEEFAKALNRGGDSVGGGSIDNRRYSRAGREEHPSAPTERSARRTVMRRVSNISIDSSTSMTERRFSNMSANRASFLVSARRNSQEITGGFSGSVDQSSLPLSAVRLKFGIETHLLPLFDANTPTLALSQPQGKSQNSALLKPHLPFLRKIFKHFAHEQGGDMMHIAEFLYMLMKLQLLDTKLNEFDAANLTISATYYTGTARFDLIKFEEFCENLVHIAEFKTFDGVCARDVRIKNWLKNEVYPAVQRFTTIDTSLW